VILTLIVGNGRRISDATTLDLDDVRPGELIVPTTRTVQMKTAGRGR
jgi:hypothetical protein